MRIAWIVALLIATNAAAQVAGTDTLERVLPCDRCTAPVVVRAPRAAPPVAVVPVYPVYVIVPGWTEVTQPAPPPSPPAWREPPPPPTAYAEPPAYAQNEPPRAAPTPAPAPAPAPAPSPTAEAASPSPSPAPAPPPADTRPGPDVYHWVDANGVQHYSTRVPPEARARAVKIGRRESGVTVTLPKGRGSKK